MTGTRAWLRGHVRPIAAGLVLLVAVLAGIAAAGWHFSSLVLVPDHSPWSEDVEIKSVSPARIELARSDATLRPGYYGLVWQSGHAVVGPIVAEDDDTVTRRLSEVRGYLVPGLEVGFDSNVYSGNPRHARDLPFRTVEIPGELGPMPAWQIPGSPRNWAIVVHGINDDREIGHRMTPALHRAGLTSLVISYRDDLGAPTSSDGLAPPGPNRVARPRGCSALFAESRRPAPGPSRLLNGRRPDHTIHGALAAGGAHHGSRPLDAPALAWQEIIAFNATRMGFPAIAALPVELAIQTRIDVDWDSLDAIDHPEDFQLPILLFHGTDDEVVPIKTSEEFAEELPRNVTYDRVDDAGHTQSWNVNPARYERRVRNFLLQIGVKPERARPKSGSNE